jgi:hypothetical protein
MSYELINVVLFSVLIKLEYINIKSSKYSTKLFYNG